MTDYNPLSDNTIDSDSVLIQDILFWLRDNPIAMFEGATGAPRMQAGAVGDPAAGDHVILVGTERYNEGNASPNAVHCYFTRTGTYRIGLSAYKNSGVTATLRIYKNGAAVGTTRTVTATSFLSANQWTEDISFSAGDYMQVHYTESGASGGEFVVGYRVKVGLALPLQFATPYEIDETMTPLFL